LRVLRNVPETMKMKLYNLSHEFSAPNAEDKPIFLPFGKWAYDEKVSQAFSREAAERIANELAADVAAGNPGIPVYQGHPDVPDLAAKYPDKGALGWVRRVELGMRNEEPGTKDGAFLFVEWDRFPGKGFGWFSPYWFGEPKGLDNEGKSLVVVDHIASIGLVNNPNISEFRLPNESAEDNTKGNTMNIEELKKLLGLPPEATEDQVKAALADLAKAKEQAAAAEKKAAEAEQTVVTANADCCKAKEDCAAANAECEEKKAELENCRKELETAKTALANEQAAHERTKKLKTQSVTAGLANEQLMNDREKRMALVNEYQAKGLGYDAAWTAAARKNPELFKGC